MLRGQMARVQVQAQAAAMRGGLDLVSPPGYAKPGTARFSLNYEPEVGGGYRRVGGIERYSGQFQPHLADYTLLAADGGYTGVIVGNTVTGGTSGATGVVCFINEAENQLAVTKIVGGPFVEEVLTVSAVAVGTVTGVGPAVDGFEDNVISAAAAAIYRVDIAQPTGTGPIRGVAILNDVVYCWRDTAGGLATYKATAAGWELVPLYSVVSFDGGSAAYPDGGTLTQGGNTATIRRVVLESGDWGAGTAAGRFIISDITGSFSAAVAGGSGVCNLLGGAAQITQFSGGRVRSVVYNFTASLNTRRLYCCDGVNQEWEFDGSVIVPIATGMGGVRATAVAAHKNHLFYAYRSSLQHSGLGLPYRWSPLFGAGELGAGDTITNLVGVSGSESSAALIALCQDSAWVLYGSSAADWQFTRISEEAGAQADSAHEYGGVLSFDRDKFRQFKPTDTFGNFSYESSSFLVDPLIRGAVAKTAVLVKTRSLYRCFFSDGLALVGLATGGPIEWMPIDYDRTIEVAIGGEINGQHRVFYGSFDGWVYEADVGRSFDGDEIAAGMRLSSLNQQSNVTLKQYRHVEIESQTESAFALAVAAEFSDSDPNSAGVTTSSLNSYRRIYGAGLFWDFESWDRSYWDVALANRVRYAVHGQGRSISILVRSNSANELPHTIKSMTLLYTPRRLAR